MFLTLANVPKCHHASPSQAEQRCVLRCLSGIRAAELGKRVVKRVSGGLSKATLGCVVQRFTTNWWNGDPLITSATLGLEDVVGVWEFEACMRRATEVPLVILSSTPACIYGH